MQNTSYFFGDSFTQSLINENPEYKKLVGLDPHEIKPSWTKLLSNHLNTEHISFGKGGNSPQGIIDDFISNMNKFKKGDYVFITTSPMVRTIGYDDNYKKIQTWNLESIRHRMTDLHITDSLNFGSPTIVQDKNELILDYILTFLLPFQEEWIAYFEGKIKEFIELFKKQGIHVYYWSHNLWDAFSTVKYETKEVMEDDHWGIQGQSQFVEYMKNRIDNKIQFTNEKLPPFKKI
tara:strand:- start:7838 stop:8539 length:702 start_codon:yes stop_codon:yes gene_type:complete